MVDRLVQIWVANEQELAELSKLRLRQREARAYLASAGCNRLLGSAYLDRLGKAMRDCCAQLGANDREVRSLLTELGQRRTVWGDSPASALRTRHEHRRSG
jgi:hypothetical protein